MKRGIRITFRLTEEEKGLLDKAREISGAKTISSFIRRVILEAVKHIQNNRR